jgi:hypothetical protein
MMDFPSSPAIGERYPASPVPGLPVYQWDGVKWGPYRNIIGAQPSNTAPLVDEIAAPGTANLWSRGDHVHPRDTRYAPVDSPVFGTLAAQTFNVTGNISVGGAIAAPAKKNHFGNASGQTYGSPLLMSDVNVLLYNYDGLENWCGMGTDVNGHFYVRTGAGSRVSAAFAADLTQASFSNSPVAPSPANGSNDNQVATTAYVQANQAMGGPYLPTSGGTITGTMTVSYAHIMSYRAGGTTGVVYLSNGDAYFYYDGTNYTFGSFPLHTAAGRLWGSSDWTRPVTSARIGPHAGDRTQDMYSGLEEPYGGAVCTGIGSPMTFVTRYRYNQIYVEGTWYTAGYA